MPTVIRPEISKKNIYWISKHRYYELKHFCMQYPEWNKAYNNLLEVGSTNFNKVVNTKPYVENNNVEKIIEKRSFYQNKIELLHKTAQQTDPILGDYILKGIIQGLSYDNLKLIYEIPCGKDMYYTLYRKFFWILDKVR